MYAQFILTCALAAAPLVAAHGKVIVLKGDLGGNGTSLGIKGAVVAQSGPDYKTEPDTTIFWSKDINTDNDLGFTDAAGNNKLSGLVQAMALSGDTLPQVSVDAPSITGTWRTVSADGAGPLQAIVDTTATGKWSTAVDADVNTQVPGTKGQAAGFNTGADPVNKDTPVAISLPAGTTCTGTINGQSNLCLVKVSNNNKDGPFGSVFAVQQGNTTTASRRFARHIRV